MEQLNEQLDTTNMLLRRMRDQLDSAGIATVPADAKRASFKEHLAFFAMLISSIALIVVGLCIPVQDVNILLCTVGFGALFYSLSFITFAKLTCLTCLLITTSTLSGLRICKNR